MTFAFATPGVPDGDWLSVRPLSIDVQSGVHTDTKGNVYAGCGDGVHVWNPSGKLIGKIFVEEGVANFQVRAVSLSCVDLQINNSSLDLVGW